MALAGARQDELVNLCDILRVSLRSTADAPEAALAVLWQVYGMPLIRQHGERRAYGNAVLQKAGESFDAHSAFVRELGGVVIMMQEFRHYFTNLNLSTEALMARHAGATKIIKVAQIAGIAGGVGAAGAGVARTIETGSVRAGAVRAGQRALGYGSIPEAVTKRLGGGAAVRGGALWVTAFAGLVYLSALQQKAEIEAIFQHRLQNRQMTDEQYRSVFGQQSRPERIRRYWEVR